MSTVRHNENLALDLLVSNNRQIISIPVQWYGIGGGNMNEKERTMYKREFNDRKYARLSITIPKGQKATIEALARYRGQTVNGMTNSLYRAELGVSMQEWKRSMEDG